MIFYQRDLTKVLQRYTKFPVIALLGPRQSGKTTLAQKTFPQHTFLDLDNLDLRQLILTDPKGVLRHYENPHGLIIDEFQHAPELLSYIKVLVDAQPRPGYFILTGSQNFLMNAAITESLAGRVGILTLLPLSLHELQHNKLITVDSQPEELLFRGTYPRLYINNFQPDEVYPNYIQTYLERDVRQLISIANLAIFQRFIRLCAARIGQLLNVTELATACSVSAPTINHWLNILEASYIIFRLRPYWTNFSKRVTKTTKLYFFDTGLACSLLELDAANILPQSPQYGALFECAIISDLYKQFYNRGIQPPLYFWRDQNGDLEIDCLINKGGQLWPVEIKSSETFNRRFFGQLHKWCELAAVAPVNSTVVYGGKLSSSNSYGHLVTWQQAGSLVDQLVSKPANE